MRVLINFLQRRPFPRSHLGIRHSVSTWSLCIRWYPAKRQFSSACFDKSFTIPVGANGRISLNPTASIEPRSNVIVYLPPGPLFSPAKLGDTNANGNTHNGEDLGRSLSTVGDESIAAQHKLASTTGSTVVTINYRLGAVKPINDESDVKLKPELGEKPPFYRYPTPIHDTLAGFDWVLQNLDPEKLSVLGKHIGGSLALMLSLTESRSLHAVAALEPVCDWVELDEYCTVSTEDENENNHASTRRKAKAVKWVAPPDLVPLLKARENFFHTPERYFDSFASPILLLRSVGTHVPERFPEYLTGPEYPVPVRQKSLLEELEEAVEEKSDFVGNYTPNADMDQDVLPDPADIRKGMRRRKSLSRWPPFGLDFGLDPTYPSRKGVGRLEMTLPWIRVFTRETANELPVIPHDRPRYARQFPPKRVLEWQADEMVSVMRRACFWGRETGIAEEKVTLAVTRDDEWVQDAGMWLGGLVGLPDNYDS
ncbi:hypothetical protein PHISCL_08883 [Aspergillus sclerotialis]|uniref:Alpha/beta hydrolase fold-3 domain-containing protein n=1 Tax=Aspergillus sclerotialis TaxID=2070753 RepID=A0A3A2Z6P7_9EURO|nr:hypothetical protein PHISCL_08883 [Aspergillus sclerotialis]